jgi:hypothetical protein
MRSLLAGFMLLGLLSVGCKKEDTPPAAPAQAPADSATQAAGQPVNEPAPPDAGPAETPDAATAAPAAQLPAPRWETLPGWLGFTALAPDAKPENSWTPSHPKAQVVLFSEAWTNVPAGLRVKLVDASGTTQEGTYLGTSTERYGCEENTATFAAFNAPRPFPEGPVWVLPPEAEGAQAVPVREVPAAELPADVLKRAGVAKPKAKQVRAYEAGGLTFVLAKKGKLKGLMTVFQDGEPVGKEELGKGDMEGADASPLELFSPHEVGVPRPLAAFRFGADGPLSVVLGSRSYEGHNFWLTTRRGTETKVSREDGEYIYFCAF